MKVKEMIRRLQEVLSSRDPDMEVVLAQIDEDREEAFVTHDIRMFEMTFPRPHGMDTEGNITVEDAVFLALCSSEECGTFHVGGEKDGEV